MTTEYYKNEVSFFKRTLAKEDYKNSFLKGYLKAKLLLHNFRKQASSGNILNIEFSEKFTLVSQGVLLTSSIGDFFK
jgi:hypothetical protein